MLYSYDDQTEYLPHKIICSSREIDALFDPFKNSPEMPSYLANVRHRYIKGHVHDWLEENAGRAAFDWRFDHILSSLLTHIRFKEKDAALLFKLTFQGE